MEVNTNSLKDRYVYISGLQKPQFQKNLKTWGVFCCVNSDLVLIKMC